MEYQDALHESYRTTNGEIAIHKFEPSFGERVLYRVVALLMIVVGRNDEFKRGIIKAA
jgi:hypothetical protein